MPGLPSSRARHAVRPGAVQGPRAAGRAGHAAPLRARRRPHRRWSRASARPGEGLETTGAGRHDDRAVQQRRAGGRVRGPRGRHQAEAADRGARAHRDPAAGSPPRSAATTTARTRWPMSWNPRSPPGSSTWPTAGSSPWTGGSGSPPRGAHLAWRVKNGAKSVPFKTLRDPARRVGTGAAARIGLHAGPAPPRGQGHGPAPATRIPSRGWSASPSPPAPHRRAKTTTHQGPHHPAGPRRLSRPARSPPCTRKDGRSKSATAAAGQAGFAFHGCSFCPSSCVFPVSGWGGAQRARV